jgi:hypothetical protein
LIPERSLTVTRFVFSASLLVVAVSASLATAQSPAVGQLPLPGNVYGYSPLVPSVDPFPTRTSGYAPSMFLPRVGGKRIVPLPARAGIHHQPTVIVEPGVMMVPAEPTILVGPVQLPPPARAWHRFGR